MNAIKLYQTTELSYREVASHLEMTNPALVANWIRIFRAEGVDGLSKPKVCPLILSKKKEEKKIKKHLKNTIVSRSSNNKCVLFRSKLPFKRIKEAAKTGSPTKTKESIARIIDSLWDYSN